MDSTHALIKQWQFSWPRQAYSAHKQTWFDLEEPNLLNCYRNKCRCKLLEVFKLKPPISQCLLAKLATQTDWKSKFRSEQCEFDILLTFRATLLRQASWAGWGDKQTITRAEKDWLKNLYGKRFGELLLEEQPSSTRVTLVGQRIWTEVDGSLSVEITNELYWSFSLRIAQRPGKYKNTCVAGLANSPNCNTSLLVCKWKEMFFTQARKRERVQKKYGKWRGMQGKGS